MKTKDIKPGVVYGYRSSRYDGVIPVVFLAEPGPDSLYSPTWPRQLDKPLFRRRPGHAKPQPFHSASDPAIGWPAVSVRYTDSDPADLLKVTLADFEAMTEAIRAELGVHTVIVTNPAHVLGTYEQALARQQAESEGRDAAAKRRLGSWERLEAAKTGLASHGITGERLGSDALTLDVDQAEKLLGRLDKATDAWADPFGQWTAEQADAARQMKAHIIRILTEETP